MDTAPAPAVGVRREAERPLTEVMAEAGPSADFRALFDASPAPLLVVAPPDWTIVAANDVRLAITGTTRAEQIGRRLFDLFPDDPEDPNADGVRNLTASFERVVATGSTDTMAVQRYAVRGADGRFVERWWAPVNKPVLGTDGKVALVIHHAEDVTEVVRLRGEAEGRDSLARDQQAMIDRLRASETALRESEARRDIALDIARLGTFEWEPASGAVVLDARSREIFGFSGDEPLSAARVFGRMHPDDLPAVRAASDAHSTSGGHLATEYRIVLPGGECRTVSSLGGPVFGTDGGIERMVGVFADVTERSRAEQALRELNETLERRVEERAAALRLYEHIVQSDQSPVVAFDHDGQLTAFNRAHEEAFLRVFGHQAQVGDVLADRFPPEQATALRALMARALAGESFQVVEAFGEPEEARTHFDISYYPLTDETGRVIGAFHHARDITDRVRAEAGLAQAQEALRQSQKMESLGQLTGGVAHDFNNLLTIIRSSADLLRRHELSDEKRRRYVDAISDTADRAARLTAQLLAFSRRSALKVEVFDAPARVNGIADMLRTVLGSRVELAIDAQCPDCFVEADPTQFETALVNVVVNARDAMDGEGGLSISIVAVDAVPPTRGHAGTQGEFVAVSITDTGTGIAPEHLERIFEPFYTTKEVGKGTGLGLSQVFGFAKQSGGGIDVGSQVGEGTTFTLYLPRADAARMAVPSDRVFEHTNGRGRVLVVEDNVQVGEFAAQLLDDLGYRTVLAPNAAEALELLEADAGMDGGGFDVVFSDVVMPGMGGVELARRLRERRPGLPVVLTSGYSHVLAEDARHGFPLLHKPYSVEDLSRILRQASAGED